MEAPEPHSRPPRRVTLAEVARRAGVSTPLASIVMRNAPGASENSRLKVRAAARELGYRPDVRARSLASSTSRIIGVLFGRAGRFHLELIDGLYAAADERGWNLVLSALTDNRDEQRAVSSLQDFRFDALIMLGPATEEPMLAGEIPLVVLGWHVDHPAVDIVRTSDEHGIGLAVHHLVELGHSNICHLQGGTGLVAVARRDAYVKAMTDHGLSDRINIRVCDGEDQLDGQRAMHSLVVSGERLPTALIAFNDDIAAAATTVLAQHGVRVPADVSIVGFDDSALACGPEISLTSVQQIPSRLAHSAVDRIIARLEGQEVSDREIVFEPELRVRSSTGPVPAHLRS